jgi:predicted transposase
MFRTIKVHLLGNVQPVIDTAMAYRQACQIALDYGFGNKTCNKNKLHAGVYKSTRQQLPTLQSSLVQSARDQACEMLKREKLKRLPQKVRLQARYNAHTFKFYPEKKTVSLTTVNGRQKFDVYIPDYFKQYLTDTYTSAQLIVKKGQAFLNIQSEIDGNAIDTNSRILGIDRGILNIVTCEDNTFVNAKHLRAVKGEYRYLKAKLQSLGTRSAKRKLQKLAGRERRFVLDTNHCISKMLVNKPYGIYVLEELHIERKKRMAGDSTACWGTGRQVNYYRCYGTRQNPQAS